MTLLERIDAGLNPIWVKELRQSLRSRLFRIAFLATLLAAATFSDLALGESDQSIGLHLFQVSYAVLTATVVGLVPFYAFYASPGEGQTGLMDLVQLTGISPWRIATGRLLMALTQVGLFYSAFLPFMAVAALLPGIDLLAAGLVLAGTTVSAAAAAAVAIALGAILRSRLVRALIGIVLAGMLFYAAVGTGVAGISLLKSPEDVSQDGFVFGYLGGLAVILLIGAYGIAGAAAALTHPEGNRSTPLRLVTLLGAILGFGLIAWLERSPNLSANQAAAGTIFVIALLGVPVGIFLVEPDRLGRRVAAQLPHTSASTLFAPLLPGGNRATTFGVLLLMGAATLSNVLVSARALPADSFGIYEAPWLALAYGAIYLLVPAMIFRRWLERPGVRWLTLLSMPGLCMVTTIVPMILGVFLNSYSLKSGHHIGNALWMVPQCFRGTPDADDSLLVEGFAFLLLLVHVPRMLGGYVEVYEACEQRDARTS